MGVSDEIDALAMHTQADFDDLFNFVAHDDLIWKDFELRVHSGHTLEARIMETGSEVAEEDLINLYPHYSTTYVQGLGFVQLTSSRHEGA